MISRKASKRSRCRVCAYKRFHPGVKLERTHRLHTGNLNVKFTFVLEGALNCIIQGSITEVIIISLNIDVLIIILITFVIHFSHYVMMV